MKFLACLYMGFLLFACSALGQTSPIGNWYGDSVCQVPGSPCKTEKVVYRIIQMDETRFALQADKIIDEKPEYMGTIEFQFDEKSNTLSGKYKDSVWKFTIKGKDMEGTLILGDGTLYRKIKVSKLACGGKSYDWN